MVRHTSRETSNQNSPRTVRRASLGDENTVCSGCSIDIPGPTGYVRSPFNERDDWTQLLEVLVMEYEFTSSHSTMLFGKRRINNDAHRVLTQRAVGPFVAESDSKQDLADLVKPLDEEDDYVVVSSESYAEFEALVQQGDYFNACKRLIDAVEGECDDVPVRDAFWFLNNKVAPPQVQNPSPAYQLVDWKFARGPNGMPSPNFWKNCTRVVEAACATLNLMGNVESFAMTNRERKQAYRDVTWNPYVIYTTQMKDAEMAPFQGNEEFFRMLYLIRNRISLFGDYGYKTLLEGFVGQGAAGSNLSEVFERVKASASQLKELSLSEVLERALNAVWGAISGILELITNSYRSVLKKIRTFLKNYLIETFELGSLLNFVQSDEFKQIMFMFFAWTMLIFFTGCFVISYNTAAALICRMREAHAAFRGEAEIHPSALVATLAAGIFGLSTKDEGNISRRARYLCTLMAGGTVVANLGACCFSLLPEVLKDALEYKWGSKESRLKREVNQWRASANALIHLSKVPRVVSSDVYIAQVKETMSAGSSLLNKMVGNTYNSLRSACLAVFIRLQKIHMNIVQFLTGSRTRDEPFCVHIFGRPGIGKSTLEKKLQARAFGIMPHESYPMSFDDEHHSGYMNHRSVVIDEFLVGPKELQEKTASVFLKLKSSAKVKLDMPTIDDVFVGVKGAEFDSEFIFTMSNVAYPRVAAFEASAIQRRRDVVVQFEVAKGFERHIHGNMTNPMDAFSLKDVDPTDIRETTWVKARCLPPVHATDVESQATPWMDFSTLCQYLADKYEEKKELSRVLNESMNGILDQNEDPMDIINEELRKTCALPAKPVGVIEALAAVFSTKKEEFVAEAESNRHHHKCGKCKFAYRHLVDVVELKCSKCGFKEVCTRGMPGDPFSEEEEKNDPGDDRVLTPTLGACTPDAHFHPCLNPQCNAKRGCNSSRSSLNWVCDPCVMKHGKHTPEYWAGWAHMDFHAGTKKAVASEKTFSDYREWQDCVAERILLDASTVWDALPMYYEVASGEPIKNIVRRNVLLGLALGAMFGLAQWLSTEKTPDSVTFQPESDPRRRISHKSREKSRWTRGEKYMPEARKSLQTARLDVGHCVMNCIPIGANWVLTFAHGLFSNGEGIRPGTELFFQYNDQSYSWKCSADDFILCRNDEGEIELDIAFVRIGDKRCPAFKNTLSMFMRDDEFPETRFRASIRTKTGLVMTYATKDTQDYSYEGTRFRLRDGFRYDAHTTSGDCGTPLLMAAGDHITKCAGIHVAGSLSKTLPVGLAVRISREMIEEAIGEYLRPKSFVAESDLLDRLQEVECPNLVSIEMVPPNAQVHLSTKTKLKESVIAPFLPFKTSKQPAILSSEDPRSQGKDPVDEAIVRLATAPKVEVDEHILDLVEDETFAYLKDALDYSKTGGLRELTFEEAVFGIPGALSSVVTSTNAGSPYSYFVNKNGKRELIWFEGTEGKVSDEFRCHVMDTYNRVRDGEPIEKVFLGFQKDEVRSASKIEKVATRITYSNDVTYNVVCRMLFGSMVVAFNHSFPKHGYALGINPSSYDANKIYDRVRKNPDRLVDGDFPEYDERHQRQIMDRSFKVLKRLGVDLDRSDVIFEHVRVHETTVPLIIGRWKLRTKCNNPSGGFWTTILNCITAEMYFRYGFKISHPGRIFEDWITLVILGDDHIICVARGIEWNALQIREAMKSVGQGYTSAHKDQELTAKYKKFSEILFLGHHFTLVYGSWSGALRKSTLEESVLWTRNNNKTIVQECQQMIEYASQWDSAYFEWYKSHINSALERCGLPTITLPPWTSLRRTVAERTTENSVDFRFVAQADSSIEASITGPTIHNRGLVTIDTNTMVQSRDVVLSRRPPTAPSQSETPGSMKMGIESFVRRGQWNWEVSNGLSSLISGFTPIAIPFGLLAMGDQSNIQNMGFQNFQFSQPDVEIMIQLNGSPTQAGCLIAYFVPLSTSSGQLNNYASFPNVKLSPCDNPTATLRIPFRYWRTMMDNQFAHDNQQRLGYFHIRVYSPLVSISSPQNCGVTIFSRFITTQRIPRVLPVSQTNTRPLYGFTRGTGTLAGQLLSSDTTWVAQGGNVSTTNVQNTYSIGDVAGSIPMENGTKIGGSTQSLDQKAELSAVPLDNPPLVGGGIPVVNQFPSMSKTNGPETTTGLYLHPQEMFRQPFSFRDSEETRIDSLMARPGRIYNFSWSTTQADGTDLYTFDLDSLVYDDSRTSWGVSWNIPVNVFIMNLFKFAHFDVVFSVHAVRTRFHSGRLQASVSYSMYPDIPAQKNALYNNILDFNAENSVQEFRVPWNAAQEFIRTSENKPAGQSSRLGMVTFSVLNELRVTSEVVATSVDVIVEIRFENVRVAMPNPYSVGSATTSDRMTFIAEAGEAERETSDVNAAQDVISTTNVHDPPANRLCRVNIGQKFEYEVGDIHELIRRYTHFPFTWISNVSGKQASSLTPTVIPTSANRTIYRIPCVPPGPMNHVFAGWSGMQKFRIYAMSSAHCTVSMSLATRPDQSTDTDLSHVLTMPRGTVNMGTNLAVSAPAMQGYMAREVMYPIGSQSFIDVSVPFSSEMNFLPSFRGSTDDAGPRGVGYLYVNVPLNTEIVVYWAAGDDFRYHVFSPEASFRRLLGINPSGALPIGDNQYGGIYGA